MARRTPRTLPLPAFDARSVMLFASLTLGSALGAQAQLAAPGTNRNGLSPGTAAPALSAPALQTAFYAGMQDVASVFRRADSNGDGRLSRAEAEHVPAASQQFDSIDTNHDGALTPDELAAAFRR